MRQSSKMMISPNRNLITEKMDVLTRSNSRRVENWSSQNIHVQKSSRMLISKNQTCCMLMIAKSQDPKGSKVDEIKKTKT